LNSLKVTSYAAAIAVYVLILIGGFVKATGAGMACPDWPLCNGRIVPELSPLVLIEYSHRLWTIMATVLVLTTSALAWIRSKARRTIVLSSTVAVVLIFAQILLGMVTVRTALHPLIVTAHLGLATAIFGASLSTAILSSKS